MYLTQWPTALTMQTAFWRIANLDIRMRRRASTKATQLQKLLVASHWIFLLTVSTTIEWFANIRALFRHSCFQIDNAFRIRFWSRRTNRPNRSLETLLLVQSDHLSIHRRIMLALSIEPSSKCFATDWHNITLRCNALLCLHIRRQCATTQIFLLCIHRNKPASDLILSLFSNDACLDQPAIARTWHRKLKFEVVRSCDNLLICDNKTCESVIFCKSRHHLCMPL